MQWETVIGLEVHVQLATHSKIFSGSPTTFGAQPNTQACALDLGMPGTLPVLNHEVVNMAIKFGLAINAQVAERSIFSRKNYFYPDLPKGYQITQHNKPIIKNGALEIALPSGEIKSIRITKAHLEEDAGKSMHENNDYSSIDLNRAGMPLLEIVSEPDLSNAKEAVSYLKTLHALVRYLGICDGNMQEGSFRCDANVSVRPEGQAELGTRTEIKNLNSFRFVEKAINYEIERQINLISDNGSISQETRLYDSAKNETRTMRAKIDAEDYRYFNDPDLCPLIITAESIEKIKAQLPELPTQKRDRFQHAYSLSAYDATILVSSIELADYFESCVKISGVSPKLVANWVNGELAAALNRENLPIAQSPLEPVRLAQLLKRFEDQTISGKIAKVIFEHLWQSTDTVDAIIEKYNLLQISDNKAIEEVIDKVIQANPTSVEDYKKGKEKLFGFFIGEIMKTSGGKINPQLLQKLLKEKLT